MPTSIFLLGAGASKAAGAPLMAEFLNVARNLRRSGLPTEFHAAFDRVFQAMAALQAVHSKATLDFNNVESLFSAFEVAKTVNKLPGYPPEDIDAVIDALRTLIVVTLERTISFPYSDYTLHTPRPYGEFVDLLQRLRQEVQPSHKVTLLTFNYDICIDFALYKQGLDVHYGLDGTSGDGASIPLLKLHGSLNWTENFDSKAIVPWKLEEYLTSRSVSPVSRPRNLFVPIGSQLGDFKPKDIAVTGVPVIVAPTFNKGDSHRTLSKVWKVAADELGKAENIFILGYSFPETDKFFEYLYGLGTVGPTLLERIWLFNPDSSGRVRERFETLIGAGARQSFRHFQETFEEAIETLSTEFPPRS
jgi:hypothetical protein